MKIALIGPVYPYKGGISHYTGLLCRALAKEHEVICFSYSLQYPKILFKKEQRDYTNKSFEIKDARFVINTANPFNWGRAAKMIREEKPRLLILQWWHPYFAPCYQAILKRLKGIPKAFICHNVLPHERFPLDKALTKATLKAASFCVVHSSQDSEDLKSILPSMPQKINPHPSYNAFKLTGMSRVEARAELGIGEDEKLLLFFGLVRKYKGLDVLIEAAAECVEKLDKLRIIVAGDFGDKYESYAAKIKESPAAQHFIVHNSYVPDTGVEKYFAAADLCVCPYLSATQSGIVQIAFGFELPVMATAVGGLPEAVADGRTGFIVPPGDSYALAQAIIRFFKENKADEFKANIRSDARRFSWERMTDTIMRLYKENCP